MSTMESQILPRLALLLVVATTTHLVVSFAQALMHYRLGHHLTGGKFFRNHINFHHTVLFQRSSRFTRIPWR